MSRLSPNTQHLAREAARAFGYALVLSALALLLGALSDEGNVTFVTRVARALPATAAAAGAAALWCASRARASGELRAYATCGGNPARLHSAWSLGGAGVGVIGAVLLVRGAVSSEGFVPPPPVMPTFRVTADSFESVELGVLVQGSSIESLAQTTGSLGAHPLSSALVAFYLVAASVSLGTLGARGSRLDGLRALTLVLVSLVVLLLVSADRVPPWSVAGLGLVALAVAFYKRKTPMPGA